jgi:hypothetical protein
MNLLGVYSGRINEQSDLGVVWKIQAVRDILAARQVGTAGLLPCALGVALAFKPPSPPRLDSTPVWPRR